MANFNEHALEMSIMELFKDEEYVHLNGRQIHRHKSEVLLLEDLRQYLYDQYASDGITSGEIETAIFMLTNKRSVKLKNTMSSANVREQMSIRLRKARKLLLKWK